VGAFFSVTKIFHGCAFIKGIFSLLHHSITFGQANGRSSIVLINTDWISKTYKRTDVESLSLYNVAKSLRLF